MKESASGSGVIGVGVATVEMPILSVFARHPYAGAKVIEQRVTRGSERGSRRPACP